MAFQKMLPDVAACGAAAAAPRASRQLAKPVYLCARAAQNSDARARAARATGLCRLNNAAAGQTTSGKENTGQV